MGWISWSKKQLYFRFLFLCFLFSNFSPLFWMTGSGSRCHGEFWISRKEVNVIEYFVAPILIRTPLIILNAIMQFFIVHRVKTVYFQLVFTFPLPATIPGIMAEPLYCWEQAKELAKIFVTQKVQPF